MFDDAVYEGREDGDKHMRGLQVAEDVFNMAADMIEKVEDKMPGSICSACYIRTLLFMCAEVVYRNSTDPETELKIILKNAREVVVEGN